MRTAASVRPAFHYLGVTLLSFTALIFASTSSAQPSALRERGIRLIELDTLGGNDSGAWAIDEAGQVVGWSLLPSGQRRGFSSCEGCKTVDLGTLIGGSDSLATAVSDNGQWLVGSSGINAFGPMFDEFIQGFVFNRGAMNSVGALFCPCSVNRRYGSSEAFGVNDVGTVVGWAASPRANYYHGFIWKDGYIEDISDTGLGDPSYSRAFAINNHEQIVGDIVRDESLTFIDTDRAAFIWQDGFFTELQHLPGYSNSTAVAINEQGQVAGWSGNADYTDSEAAFWTDGEIISIGTVTGDSKSRALALNDDGQVVGWSGNTENDSRAFFWQDGYILDLNSILPADSGWHLLEARDINKQGMITGTGIKNAKLRAFLLIPPTRQRLLNSARSAARPMPRGAGPGR